MYIVILYGYNGNGFNSTKYVKKVKEFNTFTDAQSFRKSHPNDDAEYHQWEDGESKPLSDEHLTELLHE